MFRANSLNIGFCSKSQITSKSSLVSPTETNRWSTLRIFPSLDFGCISADFLRMNNMLRAFQALYHFLRIIPENYYIQIFCTTFGHFNAASSHFRREETYLLNFVKHSLNNHILQNPKVGLYNDARAGKN